MINLPGYRMRLVPCEIIDSTMYNVDESGNYVPPVIYVKMGKVKIDGQFLPLRFTGSYWDDYKHLIVFLFEGDNITLMSTTPNAANASRRRNVNLNNMVGINSNMDISAMLFEPGVYWLNSDNLAAGVVDGLFAGFQYDVKLELLILEKM